MCTNARKPNCHRSPRYRNACARQQRKTLTRHQRSEERSEQCKQTTLRGMTNARVNRRRKPKAWPMLASALNLKLRWGA